MDSQDSGVTPRQGSQNENHKKCNLGMAWGKQCAQMYLLERNKEGYNAAAARKVSKSTIFSLQTIPQKPGHSVMQFHLFPRPESSGPIPDPSSAEIGREIGRKKQQFHFFFVILIGKTMKNVANLPLFDSMARNC